MELKKKINIISLFICIYKLNLVKEKLENIYYENAC